MLASSLAPSSLHGAAVECSSTGGSMSPKSDENGSHYSAISSPSSNPTTSQIAEPVATMAPTAESPQMSSDRPDRLTFDLVSMLGQSAENNNSDKQTALDLSTNEASSPFANSLPSFPAFDPSALLQMLAAQHSPLLPKPAANPMLQFGGNGRFPMVGAANGSTNGQGSGEKKRNYPYTFQFCVLCHKNVHSSKLPCHIRQCHISKPMFQCPSCDFTSTYSKNNVKSHMVSLHGLAGEPISYMEQYAGQVEEFMKKCFPNVRGRGRPVHGRASPKTPQNNANAQMAAQRLAALTSAQPSSVQRASPQPRRAPARAQPNPLNEMFSILQSQKDSTNSSLSYLQNYFAQNPFGKTAKKEPESMEQLLQDFSVPIVPKMEAEELMDELKPDPTAEAIPSNEAFTPKYLHRELRLESLSRRRLPQTVFATFPNLSEIIDRMDLAPFERFLNEQSPLLTEEQSRRVAAVREELQLQEYEIVFALNKLDMNILPLAKVRLVSEIAPTEVDIRRFALFEQTNNIRALSDEERFVFDLAKVERLHWKLGSMLWMGSFDSTLQSILQRLHDLSAAAKFLHQSADFHTVLQLFLIAANLLLGDPNSELIGGFRCSSILSLGSFQFPNGATLIDVLAAQRRVGEVAEFAAESTRLEAAAAIDYQKLLADVDDLQRCQRLLDEELIAEERPADSLLEFRRRVDAELSRLHETLQIAKTQIQQSLEFFGEPTPEDERRWRPADFFGPIAALSRRLRR